MKVFICSRFSAITDEQLERNIRIAKDLVKMALHRGLAPFAPHLFYPEFLDDDIPEQREQGIVAGKEYLKSTDITWMHITDGISTGMSSENTDIIGFTKKLVLIESRPSVSNGNEAIRYVFHDSPAMYSHVMRDGKVLY